MTAVPEHVKFNGGRDLTLHTLTSYDMNRIYDTMRVIDGNIKKDTMDSYYGDIYSSTASLKYMGSSLGIDKAYCGSDYDFVTSARIHYHKADDKMQPYEHKAELILRTGYKFGDNRFPIELHYPIERAIVSKDRVVNDCKLLDIVFYDANDVVVAHLIQDYVGSWDEIRSRAGEFIFNPELKKEKKKKNVAGGCFFCDNATYEKENGIIYLVCNKYDGRVAETEYTGEAYPEYCKRRA